MTQSNRVQLTHVREVTPGTTPNTPRMRKARMTGESLKFTPIFNDSEEIRDDRMNVAPTKVGESSDGGINIEWSYPDPDSPLSDWIESAFFNGWVNSPTFFNDGTADSVITAVTDSSDTYTVAAGGAAVVAGHLVRMTGFTNAANNGIFKATTGTGTTIVVAGTPTLTDEAAPPATARIKVVGFQGASGDITAAAGGLASSSLDFTTLGLSVGQWIKVGGSAASDKFANTPANNDWARITAIAQSALTLDNKPSGWGVDNGASKTIKVWFGDRIKNGTTMKSQTLERGFLGQSVPTYIKQAGMVVNTMDITVASRAKATGSFTFMGMSSAESTTPLDASPDAATTGAVMSGSVNVGRIAENGAPIASPNWMREFMLSINNNLRALEAIDSAAPVAIRDGECTVTGKNTMYFGDDTLYAKFLAGTITSLNARIQKNSQAMVWQVPAVTYNGDGNPSAAGKNQDVLLPLSWKASIDATLNAQVLLDRLEYFES